MVSAAMGFETIISLLNRKIGFYPHIIKNETMQRSIEKHMSDCGISDHEEYIKILEKSDQEISKLIEDVIVPETWFFRDREPFRFLENYITTKWNPYRSGKILRILSLPCSTGEEPYSIAMTLLMCGLKPEEFRIEAIDISGESILKAKKAVYGKNSFRGSILGQYWHYFRQVDDRFQIIESVINTVDFFQANIFDNINQVALSQYNIIFCRNLLIYFDGNAKEKALKFLDDRLMDKGLIFLGHAEMSALLGNKKYARVDHDRAFAFQKTDVNVKQESIDYKKLASDLRSRRKPEKSNVSIFNKTEEKAKKADYIVRDREKTKIAEHKLEQKSTLEMASMLADKGRLDEAMVMCETCLNENGPNSDTYFLLGLINHASGNDNCAEQFFNKTVYLNPDHYDALIHIALIMENRNEIDSAKIFRQRAQRAKMKG